MCSAEAGAIARTQAVWRATLRQARECECPAAVSGGGGWGFQRVTDIERRRCGRRAKLCLSRTAIPPKTSSSRHPKQRAPSCTYHHRPSHATAIDTPIANLCRSVELSACDTKMTTVPVSEVKSTHDRSSRTAAHSHIKGLGLSSDGRATPSAGGFVGQAAAREVLEHCTRSFSLGTNWRRHVV